MLVDCDDDTVLVKVKRLGDGNVCHTGERTCFFRRRCRRAVTTSDEAQARHPERLAAGRDRSAVRARRLQHLRQLAVVLSGDRRSRDRVHADPRAGDGALRLGRRARRRAHRPGLDRRARARATARPASSTSVADLDLRQAELRQGPLGARRARGLAVQDARRISRARRSPPSWCA